MSSISTVSVIGAAAIVLMPFQSMAQVRITIYTKDTIKKLIGPFPAAGSVEEAEDYEILFKYQENRTDAECAAAEKQVKPTIKNMFVNDNGPLTKAESIKITPIIMQAYLDAGANVFLAKNIYKRPRPFNYNDQIRPCISHNAKDKWAYPSGHAATSRAFARILGRLYPERKAAFLERADQVAKNRVLGGVHHPSDIVAGKKLGGFDGLRYNQEAKS